MQILSLFENHLVRDLREPQKMSSLVLPDIDWGHITAKTLAAFLITCDASK